MKKRDLAQYDLRLLTRVEDGDAYAGTRYLNVRTYVVYSEGGEILNPTTSGWGDPLTGLAGMTVGAQLDNHAAASGSDFYGRDVTYRDEYSVDVRRAETMARTLRQLHTFLAKQDGQYGVPLDYPSLVGRVGAWLGISTFGYVSKPGSLSVPGEYRWTDVDGLREWLRQEVQGWTARHGIVVTSAGQ